MQVLEAKTLFDAGQLKTASVLVSAFPEGFILVVSGENVASARTIDRLKHEAAVFETIDAAVSAARSIGFREVTVHLDA